MNITLCGSCAFIDEMDTLRSRLEEQGHTVKLPPVIVIAADGTEVHTRDYYKQKKATAVHNEAFWKEHTSRIRNHFNKVAWSDAVLIVNHDKNGIAGYIGPNTLMELGLAFHLNKKLFLLNPIPDVPWKEELLGMQPTIIHADLTLLT